MDEFEKWKDEYALYAERDITEADCLAAFKAGREAGMREAAKRCDELWRKWYAKYGGNTAFDAAYTTALQNASSDILAAIGGGK